MDWYREWHRHQASRQKVELLTVAFNRKASVVELAPSAAEH
jgi:hypothetical protein